MDISVVVLVVKIIILCEILRLTNLIVDSYVQY